MQATDFVTVGTFGSRPEAEVSRARLESEGLEAFVRADDAGGFEPQLGLTNGVRLVVRAPLVALAIRILEPPDPPVPHRVPLWVAAVAAFVAVVLTLLMALPAIVTLWRAVT